MNMRRNEPCFCGSGKRYKNCHGALAEAAVGRQAAAEAAPAGAGAVRVGGDETAEQFARACELHEKGQLERAQELYEAVLSKAPDDFEALSALGMLRVQRNDLRAAEGLLRRALGINADSEEANFNLAAVLCDLGRAEESLPFFDKTLAANPDSVDGLNNRGVALLQLQRHAEALADFRRAAAIAPDDPALLTNLGSCLNEVGDLEGALECLERALSADEANIGALVNKSDALNKLKRYSEAYACADRALLVAPNSVEALNNRGNALRGLGRFEEALASYERALALRPGYVEALSNRGHVLQDLQRHEEALASFDQALALEPHRPSVHTDRGNALFELMRYEDALSSYARALALRPDYVQAIFGRGSALCELSRREEGLACYERALALRPDYAEAHLNSALCCLRAGDFERGWRDYEWRWRVEQLGVSKPQFKKPAWEGTPLEGALLAWGEQGLGDQVLHLSMLPQLAKFARRLIVAVEPRLVSLVKRSFPEVEVTALSEVAFRADFDRQVPLGSIGMYLRRRWEDFPEKPRAYLRADADRSRRLREQLNAGSEFLCGLSWFSTNARVGMHKSVRLRDFLAMLSAPGVRFVDLQYGDTDGERTALRHETGMGIAHVDAVDNLNDIDGIAALIDACDCVVTVSNTTAHLAGALGKRVLVLLPFAQGKFWYWHDERDDSPWYPHVRLFRQPSPGDWASVIESATREMKERGWNP